MRIFISSSDVTIYLLRATLHQLHKHWVGHPPVVIGGYTPPTFDLPSWATFYSIGKFSDYPVHRWSDGVREFIIAMPDEVFIWHMDDFVPIAPIDGEAIKALHQMFLASPTLARLDLTDDRSLSGGAKDEGELLYTDINSIDRRLNIVTTVPETPYQLSYQTGFWRKPAFLEHVISGETPAQSEIHGASRMSRSGAIVAGTREAPIRYLIAMQHGKPHLDDSGYQSADTKFTEEDRDELVKMGYPRQ